MRKEGRTSNDIRYQAMEQKMNERKGKHWFTSFDLGDTTSSIMSRGRRKTKNIHSDSLSCSMMETRESWEVRMSEGNKFYYVWLARYSDCTITFSPRFSPLMLPAHCPHRLSAPRLEFHEDDPIYDEWYFERVEMSKCVFVRVEFMKCEVNREAEDLRNWKIFELGQFFNRGKDSEMDGSWQWRETIENMEFIMLLSLVVDK